MYVTSKEKLGEESMKKLVALFISAILIITSISASATEDPRLDIRSPDIYIPYADGQQFTRYTPWLKMLHPMSSAELTWGVHGGEGCQQIRCIDISPVDPELAFFGTDTTGVWITENGGEFWYNTNKNMIPTDVASVFCHPTNENIVFAYQKNGGIYRSTDKGKNWSLVLEDYLTSSMTDGLIANDAYGNLYAVTGRGIVKSTDSGANWTTLYSSNDTTDADNVCGAGSIYVSDNGQTIIAAYRYVSGFNLSGLYVSFDGGSTWNSKNATAYGSYAVEVDPSNSSRWFASFATNSEITEYGFYVSTNSGTSWTAIPSVDNDVPIVQARIANNKLYTTYSHRDRTLRYVNSSDFERITWTLFPVSWNKVDISAVGADTFRGGSNMYYSQGFDFSGSTMYLCAGGVNKSTDAGETFIRKSSGFSGINVEHYNMSSDGKIIMSVCDIGTVLSNSNYTSSNIPTFTRTDRRISTMSVTDPNNPNHIIAWDGASNTPAGKILGIVESTDGGVTFGEQKDNTHDTSNPVIMQYDVDNSNIIYTSQYTSYDNGATWSTNTYYILAIQGSRMMAVDRTNSKLMYSENKGTSWRDMGNSGVEPSGFFDESDSNIYWYKQLWDFGTISLTTGKRASYKGKTDYDCFAQLIANPENPNHMLLSCKGLYTNQYCPSLYESIDHGNTWHVVPGFFGRRTLNENSICFSTTTNEVFIGCLSGIYVYEYDNFKYYKEVTLKADTSSDAESIYTSVDRYNDNIIAPASPFTKNGKKFWGWRVNGEVFFEGESIPVN